MLPELQAERQLSAVEAASVPYMAEDARRETLETHQRRLGREHRAPRATPEMLAMMGIPVRAVPAKGRRGRNRSRDRLFELVADAATRREANIDG